jgi:hypothetical protein
MTKLNMSNENSKPQVAPVPVEPVKHDGATTDLKPQPASPTVAKPASGPLG